MEPKIKYVFDKIKFYQGLKQRMENDMKVWKKLEFLQGK